MTQAISDPKQASAALAELFETHCHVVFFGGAGVSTPSWPSWSVPASSTPW